MTIWVSLWGHYPGCSVEWLPVAAEGRPSIAAIMLPIAAEGRPAVAAIIEWWTAAAGSSTHTPSSLGVGVSIVPPHVEVLVRIEDVLAWSVVLQVGPQLSSGHLSLND